MGIGLGVVSSEIRCRGIYDLISRCRFMVDDVLIDFLVVWYRGRLSNNSGTQLPAKNLLKVVNIRILIDAYGCCVSLNCYIKCLCLVK